MARQKGQGHTCVCGWSKYLIVYIVNGRYIIGNVGQTASMSMLTLVYLDSKRVSILIEAVWPTLPML